MQNNGWSELKEQSLFKTVHQCRLYKWMHGKSAKYYHNRDRWLGVPAIFFSAISGIGTFASLQGEDDCGTGSNISAIVIGCVMFSVSFLTGLQNFMKYNQLSERHSTTSKEYAIIINNIRQQLTLDSNERENGTQFVNAINERCNTLITNSPDIPEHIWNNFMKELESGTLFDETGYNIKKYDHENNENGGNVADQIDVVVESGDKSVEERKAEEDIKTGEEIQERVHNAIMEDSDFQKAFYSRLNKKMPKSLAKKYEYQLDRFN